MEMTNSAPPIGETPLPYGDYYRLDIATALDPMALQSGNGVYVHARFCAQPQAGRKAKIIAFGPAYTDRKFIYSIFLVSHIPEKGKSYPDSFFETYPPYDLKDTNHDVCVRLSAPGYPVAAQSGELRIPARAFRAKGNAN
jgi:hypothetical protein